MVNRESVLLALGLTVALLACKASAGGDDLRATVSCEGTNETIDCDVKHTAGSQGANVCWDLRFGCLNGSSVTGQNFCQSVQPGSTVQKRIPLTQLTNASACDQATSSQVENVKISAM
jgi:hypothetical protein